MKKLPLAWHEAAHTAACNATDSAHARRALRRMEYEYWNELESDINVYMTHQRMTERQYWLDVGMTCEPIAD